MEQIRELRLDEIEVRVISFDGKYGSRLALYKTARVDMDILDEVFGAENWSCEYKEIKGNLFCGITINFNGEKVTKWDCGAEPRDDGDGSNIAKGEASDAFKRAAFKWGIGRELYTGPKIYLFPENIIIDNGRCRDSFSVKSITIQDHKITALEIANKYGQVVYKWDAQNGEKRFAAKSKQSGNSNTALTQQAAIERKPTGICYDCGKDIKDAKTSKGIVPAEEIIQGTRKAYGFALCAECAKRRKHAGKQR